MTRIIRRAVPEVGEREALKLLAITILVVAAAWPSCQPTEAVRAAFAADPTLAALHTDFVVIVRRAMELTISGLLSRHDLPCESDD